MFGKTMKNFKKNKSKCKKVYMLLLYMGQYF